jgi:membrane protein implicated in regulation of membrane protease activity
MDAWFWVWVGLAAILTISEMFTGEFFMLPFGLGAAVAAGVNYAEASLGWQWAVFVVASVLFLGVLRRWGPSWSTASPRQVGGDRLIGECGTVVKALDPQSGRGAVVVGREHWSAVSVTGEPIAEGERISVVRIEGAHLIVRSMDGPCDKEHPSSEGSRS